MKKTCWLPTILLLIIAGCTSIKQEDSDLKRRNIETYFNNSGVVRYFLPDLPKWANFSTSGKCFRQSSIRYFDLAAVRNSFFLTYEQAIQQQLAFNQLVAKTLEPDHRKYITLQDEERYFFEASEKIQAGIRIFQKPKYKRIHVVWIDHVLENPSRLKKLMATKRMELGHPVYLSMCSSRTEVIQYLRKNGLNTFNIRIISQEMFSPFDEQNNKVPAYALDLAALFDKNQKIYFFNPNSKNDPPEIIGDFKTYHF
jgi:hypothetical protein